MTGAGMTMLLGLLMGMEHATDADHVVAVSTIASRSKNLLQSCLIGLFWGIGHTATLLLMCTLMVALHFRLPPRAGLAMDFVVGIVLVLLGAAIIKEYISRRVHAHEHEHDQQTHSHFHSHDQNTSHEHEHERAYRARALGLGCIHGLAGSGALMVMVASQLSSWYLVLLYILVFGIGTLVGMLLISGLISLPFLLAANRSAGLHHGVRALAGTVSVCLGLFLMYNMGVVQGLFRQ